MAECLHYRLRVYIDTGFPTTQDMHRSLFQAYVLLIAYTDNFV